MVGFGKHHASMYTGSLVGKGAEVFAVMGYIIANMRPRRIGGREDGKWRMVVEMNPKLLAFIIGAKEGEIAAAIDLLCAEDSESRTKDEGGRRLLKIGQFDYVVVNGRKYRGGRDPEIRRQQNRESQARFREKNKLSAAATNGQPAPASGETVREAIRRRVKEDPQSRADAAALRAKNRPAPVPAEESLAERPFVRKASAGSAAPAP